MTRMMSGRACARGQGLRRWLAWGALLVCGGVFSAAAQAQAPDVFVPLGQIIGDQVSVVGPSRAVTDRSRRAIEFSSGDAIVVFSGKARIEFSGGDEADICGPAKFTVLSSGEALTIALSFGRVHARFDALRPVTVYTARVVATPISLGDRTRDATVGLTNTGTMCVLAAQGAVRLQNQLSGETVIVPEPSEVLVPGVSFTSLPASSGQCRCDFDEPTSQSTQTPPPLSALPLPSAALEGQLLPVPEPARPSVEHNSPTPTPQPPALPSTAASQPVFKATLPPVGYDSKSATETAEPLSVATLMLAQQTVVQPAWTFRGTVVGSGKRQNTPPSSASAKKPGFWRKLHNFFAGSH